MAINQEIAASRHSQERVINTFRDFYRNHADATVEEKRVSLVSHHDPTIRFTNSTTSVMKPYLTGDKQLRETLFLTQPAMGTQGLDYWRRTGEFGPYASYFVSLGALYRAEVGRKALGDMIHTAASWGLDTEELTLKVHTEDDDLIDMLHGADVTVEVDDSHPGMYRHQYGLGDILGRNANLETPDVNGIQRVIGNFTLIHLSKETLAYEVSFDSPTATALVYELPHPAIAHEETIDRPVGNGMIAEVDMGSVSGALLLEGLEPSSRGRAGVLRKFMTEYIDLGRKQGKTPDEIQQSLEQICQREDLMRAHLSEEDAATASITSANDVIARWTGPLYDNLEKRSAQTGSNRV